MGFPFFTVALDSITHPSYYYVDVEGDTVTKLGLDSYIFSDCKKAIRVKEPMGIRFRASILTSA